MNSLDRRVGGACYRFSLEVPTQVRQGVLEDLNLVLGVLSEEIAKSARTGFPISHDPSECARLMDTRPPEIDCIVPQTRSGTGWDPDRDGSTGI